jgi:WD40 repeat protein
LIYSNGFGLAQLDLSTGVLSTWLKPDFNGHTFGLSEDGRLFASFSDIPRTINIRDIKTGQEQTLNFKEKYNILEIRWTPDGARLVVFTEEKAEDPSEGGFSIFVYDFQSDELNKLVDKNSLSSIYSSDEFEEPRIYISDLSNETLSLSDIHQEAYFKVDLQSGELTQTDDLGTPIAVP